MKLYVGNLPRQTTEAELRKAFEAYGEVGSLTIGRDKVSGESRAFLEMPDRNSALNALNALNGRDFGGRNLNVTEAGARADDDRGIAKSEDYGHRRRR